jgi:hypothetical protein
VLAHPVQVSDDMKLIMHRFGVHSTTIQPEFVARPRELPVRAETSDQQGDDGNLSRARRLSFDDVDGAAEMVPLTRVLPTGDFEYERIKAERASHAKILAAWRAGNSDSNWCHEPVCGHRNCTSSACCKA